MPLNETGSVLFNASGSSNESERHSQEAYQYGLCILSYWIMHAPKRETSSLTQPIPRK